MKIVIDQTDLIAQIAEGILAGLNRDGWLPAKLEECQHPGETVEQMRTRFAVERARNIVMPMVFEAELAAEEAAVAA